jgi:YD repeat-containing protein
VRSTYAYDSLGRTTVIEHRRVDTTLLFRFANQYDVAGNPTRETSMRWDIGLGTTVPYETQYRYNARHELTGDKYFKNGVFILDLDYSYDPAGNRARKVTTDPTTPNSPVTIDSTYRADNQIATAVRTAPLDPPQTTTYAEDANGNLTQEAAPSGTTSYSYNFHDKLRRVDLPGGPNVQFRHTPDGRRVEKTGPGGTVTRYVLDGVEALLEKDASGTTQVRYVPARARISGGDVRFYLEDRLGSVVALVDSTQAVSDTFRHDAWGTVLQEQVLLSPRISGPAWRAITSIEKSASISWDSATTPPHSAASLPATRLVSSLMIGTNTVMWKTSRSCSLILRGSTRKTENARLCGRAAGRSSGNMAAIAAWNPHHRDRPLQSLHQLMHLTPAVKRMTRVTGQLPHQPSLPRATLPFVSAWRKCG